MCLQGLMQFHLWLFKLLRKCAHTKAIKNYKGNNSKELAPSPYVFIISICLVYMNEFARFDENSSRTLQDVNTPIPLDGVSAMFRNFGQNDTKRGRNAKSAAETPKAQ